MANENDRSTGDWVIQRTSETVCEWWTGTDWSEDDRLAKRFDHEPDVSVETLDESARAQRVEDMLPVSTGNDLASHAHSE